MTTHEKEIGINKPTAFTGDRLKVRAFTQECLGYLQLNKHIYKDDESKIAFVLSFCTEKEAQKWKETYLGNIYKDEQFEYPTFKKFLETFMEYFKPINQMRTANTQLLTLKQGKKTVEEYVAEFRLLISLAGMPSESVADNIHLINYFQRGLNQAIARKILLSDNVPTTVAGWAERAIQIDNNYRMTMSIFGKKPAQSWTKDKDPDAMDVDAMSTEKRTALMKKGACFICEEPGHMARNHKEYMAKKKGKSPQRNMPKKDVRSIHALLQGLTKAEKEELLALSVDNKEEEPKADGPNDEDF